MQKRFQTWPFDWCRRSAASRYFSRQGPRFNFWCWDGNAVYISAKKCSEWKSLLVAQVSHVRNYKMQMRMGIHSGKYKYKCEYKKKYKWESTVLTNSFHQFTLESRLMCGWGRRIQDAALLSFWRHGEYCSHFLVTGSTFFRLLWKDMFPGEHCSTDGVHLGTDEDPDLSNHPGQL